MQMCHSLRCRQSSAPKSRDFGVRYENDIVALLPKCTLDTHSLALTLSI